MHRGPSDSRCRRLSLGYGATKGKDSVELKALLAGLDY